MTDAGADTVASAVNVFRHRLDHLMAEGRKLRQLLAAEPDAAGGLAALGVWQRECAATIGQLSGGSKTHWLARAYSDAFLVPLAPAGSANVTSIVERVLVVLGRASASLASAGAAGPAGALSTSLARDRFTFVEDEVLRPHLESACVGGDDALTRGDFTTALVTFCSILDAVLTYALERLGEAGQGSREPIKDWPFADRIAAAERAGLISGGCARLPQAARDYRTLLDPRGEIETGRAISSRQAAIARQVLHVILRDLSPGR